MLASQLTARLTPLHLHIKLQAGPNQVNMQRDSETQICPFDLSTQIPSYSGNSANEGQHCGP